MNKSLRFVKKKKSQKKKERKKVKGRRKKNSKFLIKKVQFSFQIINKSKEKK